MYPMKDGMSVRCPCLFDDQNYDDWKVHMSIFIKSLGMEVGQFVVTGWSAPTKTEKRE